MPQQDYGDRARGVWESERIEDMFGRKKQGAPKVFEMSASEQAAQRHIEHLERVVKSLCPHKRVKYVESREADTWVRAAFACLLCGATLCYEAGEGSDDNMPRRYRAILAAMGIEVPGKAKG